METKELLSSSRITAVVVYARGALVTRTVEVPTPLDPGAMILRIPQITPLADPGSVRVTLDGQRQVLGVHSALVFPETVGDPGVLRAEVQALEDEDRRISALLTACQSLRRRLLDAEVNLDANRKTLRKPDQRFADAMAASVLFDGLTAEEAAKLTELEAQHRANQRALGAARLALSQATAAEAAAATDPQRHFLVRVAPGEGRIERLTLTYAVKEARWWPAYAVRLDQAATAADMSLEAFVAQSTGEDWSDVELGLCTADMIHDIRLPKLPSLRFGRQQTPARTGYRPPPADLETLFEGFDQAQAPASQPPPSMPTAKPAPARQMLKSETVLLDKFGDFDGDDDGVFMPAPKGMPAPQSPPMPPGMPMPSGAPMPMKAKKMRKRDSSLERARSAGAPSPEAMRSLGGFGGSASSYDEEIYEDDLALDDMEGGEAIVVSAEAWLRFDALILRSPLKSSSRGRLEKRPAQDWSGPLRQAAGRFSSINAPAGTTDPRSSRGHFDHRYDAIARLDVESNGKVQRVSLRSAPAQCTMRLTTTPVQTPEVFREIVATNPFGAPLLAGPIDIFVDGALVRTSPLDAVDKGAEVRFGLGVEERVRVVRNPSTREDTVGLLKGTTSIETNISIELASSLGRPITVEVYDRIPVTDDKEVTVERTGSNPQATTYTQKDRHQPIRGGLSWAVEVPAGGQTRVDFGYTISLPAKRELMGGNRRE